MVWPFEFPYFTFFKNIADNRKKVPASELNKKLIESFLKNINYNNRLDRALNKLQETPENIFFGDINVKHFIENLTCNEDKEMNSISYFKHLMLSLKKGHIKYRGKDVKYFAILCPGKAFDWGNNDLLQTAKMIFPYRDMLESYSSSRQKFLKGRGAGLVGYFNSRKIKGALYWMNLFQLLSFRVKENLYRNNFEIITLKNLQQNTNDTLDTLCNFLSIKSDPTLKKLNIAGMPYGGNLQEKELNKSVIINRSSRLELKVSTFEKKLFKSLDLFYYDSDKIINREYFGGFDMIKTAFYSAFCELKKDEIASINFRFYVLSPLWRVLLFFRFCSVYFLLKNGFISKLLLKYKDDIYFSAAKKKL